MPLTKAKGNMYDWVTHTWSILHGKCPHDCDYCYVKTGMVSKFPKLKANYEGPCRFNEADANINLGSGKKIFVAHTNDLFANPRYEDAFGTYDGPKVPVEVILRVLNICNKYPDNTYIFQTKDPMQFTYGLEPFFPPKVILGTTVETDDDALIKAHSKAPEPSERLQWMTLLKSPKYNDWARKASAIKHDLPHTTFITIEPVMKFSKRFADRIIDAGPDFVNIGADSKKCSLPEPSWEEVQDLIERIKAAGIEIREKTNLERLRA